MGRHNINVVLDVVRGVSAYCTFPYIVRRWCGGAAPAQRDAGPAVRADLQDRRRLTAGPAGGAAVRAHGRPAEAREPRPAPHPLPVCSNSARGSQQDARSGSRVTSTVEVLLLAGRHASSATSPSCSEVHLMTAAVQTYANHTADVARPHFVATCCLARSCLALGKL